mgnify:CR=1 FL=1|jgi:hypothetical protein
MKSLMKSKSIIFLICLTITACSSIKNLNKSDAQNDSKILSNEMTDKKKSPMVLVDDNGKLGDLLKSGGDEIGSVNKYLWQASLEVLNFLPINSADPFSGIIVFGKGKAPGSTQIYDATIYISDPALDARSLSVTVRSSNGVISSVAKREIENAILSKARQLRLKSLDL